MTDSRLLLTLSGVNAHYGSLHVLKGVSLHVNEGEIVTLLGANGAGKTTTLRAICGLLKPSSGSIAFAGQKIAGATPESLVRRGITQAPEGRQIFGPLSVADNLLLGAYTRLRQGEKASVRDDLQQVYDLFPVLAERRGQRGGSLSGGQQQMLAIGRALMSRPRLLLLDEPCLGLSPLFVKAIMRTVAELVTRGTTILLVEQNARAALRIAHRGYVMETGKVVLEGTAEELLRNRDVRRAYLGKDYDEVQPMTAPKIFSPRYETMDRGELAQLQLERLQATINRAYKNVPFYRRRLDDLGLQPEELQSLEDLRKLPFTTKEDLRRSYPYDMVAVPLREVVRFHLSSGTTGSPTVIAYTANDLHHWTETVARNLAACGVTRDDVVQIFFGYGLFSGGFGLHQGAEAIGASVLPLSSAELPQQVKIMQDFRSTALVGMPSYALEMAGAMDEQGVDANSLSLRIGLFGAEPWSEATRAEIEGRLHIRAYDTYGLSEMGGPGVSSECPEHNGLHLAEDHFLVEVVDPASGQPVPAGEEGELVFTTLTKEALPLLRYRSGDLSRIDVAPCPCGRTSARMARVSHRTDDMVIIHGINVFPAVVASVLAQFAEVGPHFQLVVEQSPRGHDELEVRVELAGLPFDMAAGLMRLRDRMTNRLRQELGMELRLSLLEPRSLVGVDGTCPRVVDKRGN